MKPEFEFTSEITPWSSKPSVYFVQVPPDVGADVKEIPSPPRGFGAVAVEVTIGSTTWTTSIFPNSSVEDSFFLPVKAAVRRAEGLELGDTVQVSIQLI
ncbi:MULTISPECIES: DUF1905 domain-containing protein [unclassified Salinibacterium]|uniref:DUF1905 domain-containing protein n=1 Tax=unclassified Salinibacterium TaxID=2632331 RepID=UPI0018CC826C|nr:MULTISPECIES: DUF1905 domain-containing protein [unclassified Salinibacterium]MBH0053821.1 DUF1905 domain-containing protein [Salinibacterium sp. SWN139]MBH0083082.1 DUF1905 domain-containing protein [Salinibacterium sp. SWN167]